MKKRIGSVLLALALCLSLLPTAALAAGETGTMPAYSGGNGTEDDPWQISSVADLKLLANTINDGKAAGFDADSANIGNYYGYYFKQTADIDLTGVSWEPIGYSGSYYFAGNYDADGHSITNAVSTGKVDPDGFATAGIFGWVAFGSVENLHVENANFVAIGQNNYSYVGGIAGVCYGSSIKNCSVVNSSLESKRNNNNNCAGSIVGYSTGGTFEKCAAENNQVKTMAYGGGFVGEVDDDPSYGAGTSTFTNCYTANCSVSSKTDDVQGVSLVGGFVGEMTDSVLTVNNCYVYRAILSTEGTAVPGIKATGVFAGHLWGGSSIVDTNCFFGACGTTENAGTASEKTEEEFRNGTVAGLLGEAFAQVGDYPKINGPADYSSVDAAIAKANALIKDDYKDFSSVETAINSVVQGKTLAEQAEVAAMAKAIEDAIAALQYKDADYIKIEVPFKLTVKKTGEMDPGKETFKFAIERFGATTEYVLVQDTVETEGEKTYEGKFIFTIKENQAGNLSEGFVIRQVKGNAEGWTYDETKFYAIPMFADTYTNVAGWSFLKYDENAELDYNNPIEEIGFTNSYSAKKPVVPSEPTEPTKPDDTIKSPQTGDTSNMVLWIALLLVSGSAAIGTTVVSRKKKYNR